MKAIVKKPGMEIYVEIMGIDKNEYIHFSYQFSNSDKRKIGKTYKDGKFLFDGNETINGKKFGGFSVEGEQKIEIENYIENLKKEKAEERKKILSDIVSGGRVLTVSVVGCDYPHYQAWIDGIDEKKFSVMGLMEEAIKMILKNEGVEEIFLGSSVEFLQKIHGKNIFCKNEAPSFAINPRSEKKTLDYHGFGDAVVTKYDVQLVELLNIYIEKYREKELAKKRAEEKKKESLGEVFQNEIMFFGNEMLASSSFKFLHSLAAKDDGKNIRVYTTGYEKIIPNATSTYSIKDELKKEGFVFDPQEKEWMIESSENAKLKTLSILKKYDTKEKPENLGLTQCWECGRWYKARRGDDGYCGC